MVVAGEMGTDDELRGRIVQLETTLAMTTASLAATSESLTKVTAERDRLRRSYMLLSEYYQLVRRKLFAAKAERVDVTQLELEFAAVKAKLDGMVKACEDADITLEPTDTPLEPDASAQPPAAGPDAPAQPPAPDPKGKTRPKPTGRRNLAQQEMPEERIELTDPALEGQVERIDFEESYRYGYRPAGPVRIVIARAIYKQPVEAAAEAEEGDEPVFELVTVKKPKEMLERGLLAPSLIAHILVSKYRFGLPFYRLTEMLRAQGVRVDDSTMCRYAEHVGATLGCIVDASAKEAKETAFCLSTDATGIAIQPKPIPGRRQACKKGHFFVVLADQDHIFFEYQPKHTSDAVCEMFKGFKGYVQADAHAVYDALFRGEARSAPEDKAPVEVGCWSHARRYVFEAATITKDDAAREALLRMHVLFELEAQWAELPPQQRHERRQKVLLPLVDDFFAWAEGQFELVKGLRGLTATAFGYAVRQKDALRRFLEDGRLKMTNNHSERALRSPICIGRNAWLFFSSDDHATAAANLFSLVASCKLHSLDAATYLAEMIRIVPLWPRDRYLELAPKYWARTRARLDPKELARELGPLTVPPPPSSEEKPPPD